MLLSSLFFPGFRSLSRGAIVGLLGLCMAWIGCAETEDSGGSLADTLDSSDVSVPGDGVGYVSCLEADCYITAEDRPLHEYEFKENPILRARIGQMVIVELESESGDSHPLDTDAVGADKIPFVVEEDVELNWCGEQASQDEALRSHAFQFISEATGEVLFEHLHGDPCSQVSVQQGLYTLLVTHDGAFLGDELVFLRPGEGKSDGGSLGVVASTGACEGCSFEGMPATSGLNWQNVHVAGATFGGVTLSESILGGDFAETVFDGATLTDVTFEDATLTSASFQDVTTSGVTFLNSKLEGNSFSAPITSPTWGALYMNFWGGSITEVDFSETYLMGPVFGGGIALTNVDFPVSSTISTMAPALYEEYLQGPALNSDEVNRYRPLFQAPRQDRALNKGAQCHFGTGDADWKDCDSVTNVSFGAPGFEAGSTASDLTKPLDTTTYCPPSQWIAEILPTESGGNVSGSMTAPPAGERTLQLDLEGSFVIEGVRLVNGGVCLSASDSYVDSGAGVREFSISVSDTLDDGQFKVVATGEMSSNRTLVTEGGAMAKQMHIALPPGVSGRYVRLGIRGWSGPAPTLSNFQVWTVGEELEGGQPGTAFLEEQLKGRSSTSAKMLFGDISLDTVSLPKATFDKATFQPAETVYSLLHKDSFVFDSAKESFGISLGNPPVSNNYQVVLQFPSGANTENAGAFVAEAKWPTLTAVNKTREGFDVIHTCGAGDCAVYDGEVEVYVYDVNLGPVLSSFESMALGSAHLQHFNISGVSIEKSPVFGTDKNEPPLDLRNANLSYTGIDLSGLDLSKDFKSHYAKFNQNEISETQLDAARCSLVGLNLATELNDEVKFENVDVTGCFMSGANFGRTALANTSFRHVKGDNTTLFKEAKGYQTAFDGAVLPSSDFRGAQMDYSSFVEADLNGANLTGGSFEYARLTKIQLPGANLTSSSFLFAELTGATLTGGSLVGGGADFESANLTGADLTEANFQGQENEGPQASFKKAWFCGATVTDTVLKNSLLQNAVFVGLDGGTEAVTLPSSDVACELVTGVPIANQSTVCPNGESGTLDNGCTGKYAYVLDPETAPVCKVNIQDILMGISKPPGKKGDSCSDDCDCGDYVSGCDSSGVCAGP